MKTDEYGLSRRDRLALDAAKLYYAGLSQETVAQELHIARPTVSKLVNHAKNRGFVEVSIHDPREKDKGLVRALKEKYSLTSLYIVAPAGGGPSDLRRALGRTAAQILPGYISQNESLGLVWSETVAESISALKKFVLPEVQVVQIRGWLGHGENSRPKRTFDEACEIFGVEPALLGTPAIASTYEAKKEFLELSSYKETRARLSTMRTLLYSVGACDGTSHLYRSSLLTNQERKIIAGKAVGDICSHFVDEKGRICVPDLEHRTLGISLPELRRREQKILVAGGENKVSAIHAALQWGYANILITDVKTAQELVVKE